MRCIIMSKSAQNQVFQLLKKIESWNPGQSVVIMKVYNVYEHLAKTACSGKVSFSHKLA